MEEIATSLVNILGDRVTYLTEMIRLNLFQRGRKIYSMNYEYEEERRKKDRR